MNAHVDLMPAACRAALQRRTRVRMWVGAYASTAAILVSAYAAFTAGRQAQLRELTDLNNQIELNWSRDHQVQELMDQLESLEESVQRYNKLAWPLRISDVIQTVAAMVPDDATLTSLAIVPQTDRKRARESKGEEPRTSLAIELEGVAISDGVVAELVKQLDTQVLFESVALDYARPADVDGVQARRFRVTALIDLNVSYRFIEPVASERVPREITP